MPREPDASGFMLNVHAEPDSVQAAFLRRALSALERITRSVPTKTLAEALAAPTDVGSLAQLLSRSEVVGSAVTDLDPLGPGLARNVAHRQTLLALAGGALSADEAGRIIGITRQAIDKRRRAGALLAVREGSDWRYPACQSPMARWWLASQTWCAASARRAPGLPWTSSWPRTRPWQAERRSRR